MRHNRAGNYNVLVQKKLSEILLRKSKDPRFERVTVSRVETDSDCSFAKVYVSIFPSDETDALVESLNRAAGFFSSSLGKILYTRNTPKLVFVYDAGFDYSMEIESLLKEANRNSGTEGGSEQEMTD
ncbi:30S ribosome-binding factor RbfA [Deltaproteobacteria bacterium TL4]